MRYSCNYPELIEIIQQNTPCVLATVIHTQGSTPQKAGSTALIGKNGLLAGTVGGGMTELKVIKLSQLAIDSKMPGIFSFNLGGELTRGSDSICGGNMTILLDSTPEKHLTIFSGLKKSLDERRSGVLITLADSDPEKTIINRLWISKNNWPQLPEILNEKIEQIISGMLRNPSSTCRLLESLNAETGKNELIFLECIIPKPTLIIAGAGHIGQALARLGKFLGFEVTIWDDRPEYADSSLLPDANVVLSGSVDSSLEQLEIHEDSYVVIVTRGHKSDSEVLRNFIGSGAAYIGMIGSKAKISQMKTVFLENEWASPYEWSQIHTPVGLDIGAQTVEEIAISIAAQLVQVRNQR